ncbi:exonuclease subunit SbcD [Chromobacterium sp. Panama]|uniref:exonuclease subunit SbcD n=1 Tax=Chromobacterium sp. Panama TaxID=2161826 RepID=UPI000D303D43|nr:exonuclease subunit SbcD [Chromobacterium sp. Panama]PTU65047.1 exonuclease subunit SbcD [Chromobacterium sp. Panama]
MRILHTSDWHLGQHFIGKTRLAEHQAFIHWLLEQADVHRADVVLVAGDIFDTGAPPSYARELYNGLIASAHRAGVQLVLLGGNHDSVATLAESRALLSYLSASVVPALSEDPADQVLMLKRRDGEPGALLCALPYIRPRDVLRSQAGQSAEQKQQSLQDAIRERYRQVYEQALRRREQLGLPLPIVASGHLTTVGASASESVREIYVGALEAFPSNAFPPADYIALGHIHRPQKVGGHEHIRYSGSPIPLSFDEAGQGKEVLLAELDEQGLGSVRPLAVPCFQPLRSVRGSLAQLPALLAQAAEAGSAERPVWLEIVVSADDYLSDLSARAQALCADLPLELLRVRRDRGQAASGLASTAGETLDELTPLDVFERRLALETLDPPLQEQLRLRYRETLAALREEQA